MSFRFNSQISANDVKGEREFEYTIQISTDSYEQFLFMQEMARQCIDGKHKEKQNDEKPVANTTSTIRYCEDDNEHEWECCGISSNGSSYRCKKCYAYKTEPLESVDSTTNKCNHDWIPGITSYDPKDLCNYRRYICSKCLETKEEKI